MLFRQITVFAVLVAVACSAKKAEQRDDAAPVVNHIRLLDSDSALVAELHIDAGACAWTDSDDSGSVTRDHDTATMVIATSTVAALTAGPAGRALTDHEGAHVTRIVRDATGGRISALDPQGIALFRIRPSAAGATRYDEAGRPESTITPRDEILVAKARDDTITHYVTGSTDVVVAALLTAPELSLRHRLLLACDRLLGSNHDS